MTFQRRQTIDDGAGNRRAEFIDQFTTPARLEPRLGGESVLAGRLAGQALANITVRSSTQSRAVAPEWRIRDERSGDVWAIRSVIDPDGRRQWVECLAEKGAIG